MSTTRTGYGNSSSSPSRIPRPCDFCQTFPRGMIRSRARVVGPLGDPIRALPPWWMRRGAEPLTCAVGGTVRRSVGAVTTIHVGARVGWTCCGDAERLWDGGAGGSVGHGPSELWSGPVRAAASSTPRPGPLVVWRRGPEGVRRSVGWPVDGVENAVGELVAESVSGGAVSDIESIGTEGQLTPIEPHRTRPLAWATACARQEAHRATRRAYRQEEAHQADTHDERSHRSHLASPSRPNRLQTAVSVDPLPTSIVRSTFSDSLPRERSSPRSMPPISNRRLVCVIVGEGELGASLMERTMSSSVAARRGGGSGGAGSS
jgi:hypothetical protein